MTGEQLLILVVLGLVLLSNVVARLLRRWISGEAARPRESDVSEGTQAARRPPPVTRPRRPPVAPETSPVPRAAPRVAPRPRRRAPLGGRRAVRRGIVLMTILGPCRALEPPDPHA
jgi:hypothetical protein